jgi:hypothetical protein
LIFCLYYYLLIKVDYTDTRYKGAPAGCDYIDTRYKRAPAGHCKRASGGSDEIYNCGSFDKFSKYLPPRERIRAVAAGQQRE